MQRWIDETLHESWRVRLKAERVLHESRTAHQHLVIFENAEFGRMMMLDGVVQLATRDEFIYHEMMAHVPLFAHGAPRRVLIIGGGDGGVLREVLRHGSVEEAVLCEIDAAVIDMCRTHFPEVSAGAFEDARSRVVIADGTGYVRETGERIARGESQPFDAILVDSTDPIGPGAVLFTAEFYGDCKRCLAPGGVLVTQNGLPFVQGPELARSIGHFRALGFADAHAYLATTPSYFGGPMSFGWAALDPSLRRVPAERLEARFARAGMATRYYTPALHAGVFALPGYVAALVAGAGSAGPADPADSA